MSNHNMQADGNEAKQSANKKSQSKNEGLKRRSVLKLAGASTGAAAGGLGAINYGSQPVSAASPGEAHVIDDFEDGSLNEYSFDSGSSGATIVSSPTYDGSYALELNGANTEMISMNDLGHYPGAGDVFSYWVRSTNGAEDTNFTYGVQNHENRYYLNLDFVNDQMHYNVLEGGSQDWQSYTDVTLNEDTWYRVEINWQTDGTHVATIYDSTNSQLAQISMSDSTWGAGGIGYDAYVADGGSVFYDRVVLKSGRELLENNQIVDSFEDGDLSEYFFTAGQSGTKAVSSPIFAGSQSLEVKGVTSKMFSTSGLENYPSENQVFSTWVRATNGADDTNFCYGVQDENNFYYINFDFQNDQAHYNIYKNGSQDWQSYIDINLKEDVWYELKVDWRKTGVHVASIYNKQQQKLGELSMTTSEWSKGGIGFNAYLSGEESIYWDNIVIEYDIIDGFESGDISEYTGDTSGFTVQSNRVLEGDYSLKGTSASQAIAHPDTDTARDYEYRCSFLIEDGCDAKPAFVVASQDSQNPLDSCYYLIADPLNDTLSLIKKENGESNILDESSATINRGTEFEFILNLRPELIIGSLEKNGDEVAGVAGVDEEYSKGNIGFYLENSAPVYFDRVRKEKSNTTIIADFEEGSLSGFAGDTSSYTVQSNTVLQGSNSVKSSDKNAVIVSEASTTHRGYTYQTKVLAGSNTSTKPSLVVGIQDSNNPLYNCYWARADPVNNTLTLFKNNSGDRSILDEVSVELDKGKEYILDISLYGDEIQSQISGTLGKPLASTSVITDSTYDGGSLGVYSCNDCPAYFDYISKQPNEKKHISKVTDTEARGDKAIKSTPAQKVLNELNNPTVDKSGTERINAYDSNRMHEDHVINVPIEYGNLHVEYRNGSPKTATARLDRSTMSQSLRDDLSGDFGWPSGEDAILTYETNQSQSSPRFRRTTTSAEKDDVSATVNDYEQKEGRPGAVIVENCNGGNYYSIYNDKKYLVDSSRSNVESDDDLYGSPSCQTLFDACQAQRMYSSYSWWRTSLTCLGALVEPTPFGEIPCLISFGESVITSALLEYAGVCNDYEAQC